MFVYWTYTHIILTSTELLKFNARQITICQPDTHEYSLSIQVDNIQTAHGVWNFQNSNVSFGGLGFLSV